jgi:hypothetical protein
MENKLGSGQDGQGPRGRRQLGVECLAPGPAAEPREAGVCLGACTRQSMLPFFVLIIEVSAKRTGTGANQRIGTGVAAEGADQRAAGGAHERAAAGTRPGGGPAPGDADRRDDKDRTRIVNLVMHQSPGLPIRLPATADCAEALLLARVVRGQRPHQPYHRHLVHQGLIADIALGAGDEGRTTVCHRRGLSTGRPRLDAPVDPCWPLGGALPASETTRDADAADARLLIGARRPGTSDPCEFPICLRFYDRMRSNIGHRRAGGNDQNGEKWSKSRQRIATGLITACTAPTKRGWPSTKRNSITPSPASARVSIFSRMYTPFLASSSEWTGNT